MIRKGLERGTLEVCRVPECSQLKKLLQFGALHLWVIKPTLATWLLLFSKYRVCILANRSGPPAIASRKASACTQETTTTKKAKQKSIRRNLASQLCQFGPEIYHVSRYLIGWRQGRGNDLLLVLQIWGWMLGDLAMQSRTVVSPRIFILIIPNRENVALYMRLCEDEL